MAYVLVDVESDGPIPSDYSMICFGAVVVREGLEEAFFGRLKPISDKWIPEALAVSGFTREVTLGFDDPENVMRNFADWIQENTKGRALFVSDNNGFDWQFINWYFWHFTGGNPVWPFEHEPRLAVQGNCQRHVPEFQTPAKDRPYTSSDRRRTRKCRGSLGDEGNGSEDRALSTIRSPCEA
jgi:hypothetical protein